MEESVYNPISLEKAYTLLNGGGLLWICTKSKEGRYDLAPIAWACPLDYEPVTKFLFVCDPGHATFENVVNQREFIAALPTYKQKDLVLKTGSVSGRSYEKFSQWRISYMKGTVVDAWVPKGVAGWLECKVLEIYRPSSVAIVCGETLAAFALPNAWKQVLHHVEGEHFYQPGDRV
ncbi:MAG: flavin reductase [Spirochaetes bacterium]|nr:flavin reductase [Spirochaetota bacterium]